MRDTNTFKKFLWESHLNLSGVLCVAIFYLVLVSMYEFTFSSIIIDKFIHFNGKNPLLSCSNLSQGELHSHLAAMKLSFYPVMFFSVMPFIYININVFIWARIFEFAEIKKEFMNFHPMWIVYFLYLFILFLDVTHLNEAASIIDNGSDISKLLCRYVEYHIEWYLYFRLMNLILSMVFIQDCFDRSKWFIVSEIFFRICYFCILDPISLLEGIELKDHDGLKEYLNDYTYGLGDLVE